MAEAWIVVHRPVGSSTHIRRVETFRRLHIYDLAGMPIGEITTQHVELARTRHMDTHKPASAHHWLQILKLLTLCAVKRGTLAASQWRVQMLTVQKWQRPFLSIDVAKTRFDAIDAVTWHAPSVSTAVRLMFGLGLRDGALGVDRLGTGDVHPGITESREAEPVPMPAWLLEHLRPHRQRRG